ncbi:MAG: hypothetical protein HOP33_12710 [Verrucomicrobia bacterium]|nr:hypothetical protein [Verrucomicrobiota bacterium]
MALPTMHGMIDRRMLINFRVKPERIAPMLPSFFRTKLVKGWAMAGICLIRLKDIRPKGLAAAFGVSSENAAHRIAVAWDEHGVTREGVFIPRRDTSSALQSLVGGRIFPGIHHPADFLVEESGDDYRLQMKSRDDATQVRLHARRTKQLPSSSLFESLEEASDFFARGSAGYSATERTNCCDGLELFTAGWQVEPLDVLAVESSFFDDHATFPTGTIEFDCALLMRNISHEWRSLPQMKGEAWKQ